MVSLLWALWMVEMGAFEELVVGVEGRLKTSPKGQHVNLFPKSSIPLEEAWEAFGSAPWTPCWTFKEVDSPSKVHAY
jgi:hypothetical protein